MESTINYIEAKADIAKSVANNERVLALYLQDGMPVSESTKALIDHFKLTQDNYLIMIETLLSLVANLEIINNQTQHALNLEIQAKNKGFVNN